MQISSTDHVLELVDVPAALDGVVLTLLSQVGHALGLVNILALLLVHGVTPDTNRTVKTVIDSCHPLTHLCPCSGPVQQPSLAMLQHWSIMPPHCREAAHPGAGAGAGAGRGAGSTVGGPPPPPIAPMEYMPPAVWPMEEEEDRPADPVRVRPPDPRPADPDTVTPAGMEATAARAVWPMDLSMLPADPEAATPALPMLPDLPEVL